MEEFLGGEVRKDLAYIDSLDGFERKRFLRAVVNSATRDFAFIENPECNSEEQSRLQNALLTLYTIATKHGVSNNVLRTFLAEENLREDSIEDLLEHYDHSKGAIRLKLAKYGHPIPWATNVNWKLSSVLRTSGSDEMNADLVYKITFEGAGPTGRTILTNFDCTLEELQNLSLKFKEIERNCHRIAENE